MAYRDGDAWSKPVLVMNMVKEQNNRLSARKTASSDVNFVRNFSLNESKNQESKRKISRVNKNFVTRELDSFLIFLCKIARN